MGISAVILAWLGLTAAHADSVSTPPAPPAAQSFALDSNANLTVTLTDGSTQTIAMGSVLQLASQVPQIVNNGILAALNTLNLPGTYATPAQAAAAAPVQSVNGRIGAVSLGSSDITAALGYTPYNGATNPNAFQTTTQVAQAISNANLRIPGGPFTVNPATTPFNGLPTCSSTYGGGIAFVSDLGGGGDNVVCRNTSYNGSLKWNWLNIRPGTPDIVASCTGVTISPLVTSTIQKLTCTSLVSGSSINVINATAYPGYQFTVVMPSTLTGLTTSLGINLGGTPSGLPALVAGSKSVFSINADGTLTQTQ